jgi:hypothetical protein
VPDTHAGHDRRTQAGVIKDSTLPGADDNLNDDLDAAHESKYRRYSATIINRITSLRGTATTIKLVPGHEDVP